MNSVHVIIRGKRRASFGSLHDALDSVRWRILTERVLDLVEEEVIDALRVAFFLK